MNGAPIFGPWYSNEQDDHWSVHASDHDAPPMGNRVCTFPLTEQGAARARLTAAGPDLYQALVEAKKEMWRTARHQWTMADFNNWAVVQQINAALTKADGQPRGIS